MSVNTQYDEFGIPIKNDAIQTDYDEFGIPIKKKEPTEEELESFKTSMRGVSEMPKEYASEAPSTQTKPTLNTEIEKWYADRGGMSPDTKLNTFAEKVKELNTKYSNLGGLAKNLDEVNKILEDFNKDIGIAASDLGLKFNKEEFKAELSENDIKFYEDAYKTALGKLPKEDKKRLSFLGEAGQALDRGVVQAGLGLREIAGSLLLLDYIPQYKEFNENQRVVQEQQRNFDKANSQIDKNISESLSNKEYGKALGGAILGTAESIPSLMLMFTNPTYGLLAGGLLSANEKDKELQKDENISDLARGLNVVTTGLLEIATEKLTTIPMMEASKKALINIGEEGVKNAAAKTLGTTLQTAYRRIGSGLSDATLEATSEALNQYGQNFVEKITVNPDKDITEGVVDAFAIGFVTAGVIKSPQIAVQSAETASDIAKTAFAKTPESMPIENRVNAAVLIAERDALQEDNKGIDKNLQKDVSNEVAVVNDAIKVTAQEQTIKEQVNIINEEINNELDQQYPDVIRIAELEEALVQIEDVINMEGGKKLKEINSNIESLRKERDGLYQGEQTEIEIQKDAKRENAINKELLPLLKEKQAIRNEIYTMGLGDINSNLSNIVNQQVKQEALEEVNKNLTDKIEIKDEKQAIIATKVVQPIETTTETKEAVKTEEIKPEIDFKPINENISKVKEGQAPLSNQKVFDEATNIANQVAKETQLKGEELIAETGKRLEEQTNGAIKAEDVLDVAEELLPTIKEDNYTLEEDVIEENKIAKVEKAEEDAIETERKKRRMGVKALESANIPAKMKNDLINRGIEYVVRGKKVTTQIAKEIAKVFTDSGGRDELKAAIMNPNIPMKGDVRTTLAVEFVKESLRLANLATNKAEKEKFQRDATDVYEYDMISGTEAGQAVQAKSQWSEVLGNDPEFVVAAARARARKNNADFIESRSDDVQSAQEILNEFQKSKEFKDLVEREAQERLKEIIRRKNISKDQIKKEQDYRKKRIEEYKRQRRGVASAAIIPGVTQADIEFAGDMVASYVREGFFRLAEISNKLRSDFKDIGVSLTDEQIAFILEQEKDGKKLTDILKEAQIDVADIKPKLSDKDISAVVEKIYKKTEGATKDELRTLVRDYIEEIYAFGAIDEQRFQDLFAKALGQEYLSPKQEQALRTASEKLNEARKAEDRLRSLYKDYANAVESKASKQELNDLQKLIDDKKKEYNRAITEAKKANGFISETFGKENTVGDLFGTFIQGNLLTPISLITNISANIAWIPARSSRNYLATVLDALLSQMTDGERVYNAFGASQGYMIGFYEGLVEGLEQLWTGQLPDDAYVRDISRALHPIKGLVENFNSLRGEEKIKKGKFIYNTIQGTLGVSPEIMFRLLNLGDKPFRRAAERARLSEIASLKKLKGIERDQFMMLPDAESAEEARMAGLEATFQQDNFLSNAMKRLENYEKKKTKTNVDAVDKALQGLLGILKKTQIPYVKTPTNIIIETADYALPELSLAQAAYWTYKYMKSNDPMHKRKAVDYTSRAMIGYMINGAISTLMGVGIMSLAAGGREDEDKYSERVIESEYRNKPAYYMNIDAFYRYINGGDASWQEGDDILSYKRFGIMSSIIMAKAESYRGKSLQEIQDMNFASQRLSSVFPVLKSSLDQSFLTGINSSLNAMTQGGLEKDRWLVNTATALSAVAIPNTYATIVKSMDDYIRETRENTLRGIEKNKKEITNRFKSNLVSDSGLPTKVTVWGERVERVPDGRGVGFMLFDVTKSMKYGSDFGVKLHELYERTGNTDILPTRVDGNVTYKGSVVKLTPNLTEELQISVGSQRKKYIAPYVESNNYDDDTDETRILKLKYRYDRMNREGGAVWGEKKKFVRKHKEEIKKLYEQQYPDEEK
jgi:hypothetical protein